MSHSKRTELLTIRDALRADIERRRVKGVETISIGGREGRNVLVVSVNSRFKKGSVPEPFHGIDVEIEDYGELERY